MWNFSLINKVCYDQMMFLPFFIAGISLQLPQMDRWMTLMVYYVDYGMIKTNHDARELYVSKGLIRNLFFLGSFFVRYLTTFYPKTSK